MEKKNNGITLWLKTGGKFAVSHKEGLTADQIAELQSLKVGDQVVLYLNDKRSDKSPDFTFRKFMPSRNDSGGL